MSGKLEEAFSVIKEKIDLGATMEELYQDHFFVFSRNRRHLEPYINSRRCERIPPKVEVLIGATGVGKTRYVHELARIHFGGDLWIYDGEKDKEWFDGYVGQRVALFDDFRGEIHFSRLLRLLDRYPCQVPVKGGFVRWNPERIFITSNVSYEWWYDLRQPDLAALERRFFRTYVINEPLY